MTFPAPQCVRGAILGPLVGSDHPSGVGCVADTPGLTLTHMRADTEEGPINRLETHAPTRTDDVPLLEGPTLYAGPYFAHFGHFVAESIHRLWAAHHFPHLKDARILFQAPVDAPRPSWVDAVLDMCGIAPERAVLLDHVARVEELYVPAQGRALGGALLLTDYQTLFPLTVLQPPADTPRRLYISRSRHVASGALLGESLVERVLAKAGFAIVHPQDMPVRGFAELLVGAETIIFAEGSAIHNLELTGRIKARVMVIGRRDGVRRRFGALLESLASEVRLFSAARIAGSLDWDRVNQRPRASEGCSLVPIPRLIDALADFIGTDLPQPDQAAITQSIADDLLRYLLDLRSGVNADNAELGAALRALRIDPGIAELRAQIGP